MKNLSFEIIGDILIIRDSASERAVLDFAELKMNTYPYIKSVFLQTSKTEGQKRTRNLEFILGKRNLETIHKEHGNIYRLNPLHTFFSPRLSFERQRIANLVKKGERIINFFSGVGPFSIAIATKQVECITHSVEINEIAFKYLCQNILLNKCQDRVFPYCGDAFEIVPRILKIKVNRVLLPLPLEADKSLPVACNALDGGNGHIHWQITEHLQSKIIPFNEIDKRIRTIFSDSDMEVNFHISTTRIIRWIAPRIAHIAIDLNIIDSE